jgi:hypothetical protein
MNFIKLKNKKGVRSHVSPDQVRFTFKKIKRKERNYWWYMLIIYLGKNKAEEVGIKAGDKVGFFYEEENPRVWLLKKSTDDSGHKVGKKSNQNSPYFIIQIVWNLSIPNKEELLIREVKTKPYQGGILMGDYDE